MRVSAGPVHVSRRPVSTRLNPRSQGVDKPVERVAARNRRARTGRPVDNDSELAAAWRRVIDDLQPNQQAWVTASARAGWHGTPAIISVADDFTRTQLEGRLRGQLEDALTESFGREIRLAVTVN